MASHAESRPLGVFECELCTLTAPYSYVGQKPPNTQSMVLLEESYVMKDPFTSDKDRFLVLGSRCSLCSRLVCVGPVGEHQCFSSGNSARLGEKESSIKEDPQPARFSDVSAAGAGSSGSTLHRAPGPACARDAAELGAAMPGLVSGPLGAALQRRRAGVQLGAATGPGSCSKRVAQRQTPDRT
ncbi:cysteine-rich DPF motif domain-containing protein 1 isoform X1 [Symphalangus syndactylus]|uniref:cysteine-rich DPF motif domain-containing protein 1 isoform X1 n=1 Tax=Symphalangus syndactylus TaxID=9590 RepID=UPI0030067384